MKKELGKLSELQLEVIYSKANLIPSLTPKQFMVVNDKYLITEINQIEFSDLVVVFFFFTLVMS